METAVAKDSHRAPRTSGARLDPARVRTANERLTREGRTVVEWARDNGEKSDLVHRVLSGRRACVRGASHRIAVKLGIKDGEIAPVTADA